MSSQTPSNPDAPVPPSETPVEAAPKFREAPYGEALAGVVRTESGAAQVENARGTTPLIPVAERLRSEVAEQVKKGSTTLFGAVITHFASEELDRRKNLLINGAKKLKELDIEVKKASKPDAKTFDASGRVLTEAFTEASAKKLKEAREKFDKLNKAMEKAVNDADFEPLDKALKGGGDKPAPAPADVE